jgi:magnesium and cobalt transporter
VVGILLAKDLLHEVAGLIRNGQDWHRLNIRDCLRPATIVPESKRLDTLLKEFRVKRNHMAVVVDEYGSVAGLVTIEDVLEQIVGDIEDETDVEDGEDVILRLGENEYHVKGLTDIEEFNDYFHASFDDEDVDTVGGLVIQAFGHMPSRGETVDLGQFRFTVLSADQRRVRQLKVERLPDEATQDEA